MYSSYYNATSGMVSQLNRLNIISNNLANANTTGYRADDVVFGDYMRLHKEFQDDLPHENHTREGADFLNRSLNRNPRIVEQYSNYELGVMRTTGNELDVALDQGDLFFAVETANGVRFTRDGAFKLSPNPDGTGSILTDKEGNPVLSSNYYENGHQPIKVDGSTSIDKNGVISSLVGTDQLMIAQVQNLKNLQKEGNNKFILPYAHAAIDNEGNLYRNGEKFDVLTQEQIEELKVYANVDDLAQLPRDVNLGIDKYGHILLNLEAVTTLNKNQEEGLRNMEIFTDSGVVKQGYLEGSNCNTVQQMTSLVESQRLFDMYQKVMSTQMNDINQDAINKLAKTNRT
jgi:flagellar basal-body rod protein FlgG